MGTEHARMDQKLHRPATSRHKQAQADTSKHKQAQAGASSHNPDSHLVLWLQQVRVARVEVHLTIPHPATGDSLQAGEDNARR